MAEFPQLTWKPISVLSCLFLSENILWYQLDDPALHFVPSAFCPAIKGDAEKAVTFVWEVESVSL